MTYKQSRGRRLDRKRPFNKIAQLLDGHGSPPHMREEIVMPNGSAIMHRTVVEACLERKKSLFFHHAL